MGESMAFGMVLIAVWQPAPTAGVYFSIFDIRYSIFLLLRMSRGLFAEQI